MRRGQTVASGVEYRQNEGVVAPQKAVIQRCEAEAFACATTARRPRRTAKAGAAQMSNNRHPDASEAVSAMATSMHGDSPVRC